MVSGKTRSSIPLTPVGLDLVQSYFGMRQFSVEPTRKAFRGSSQQSPVLSQRTSRSGYYPMASDSALRRSNDHDIKSQDMASNMLRKHIKIEPPGGIITRPLVSRLADMINAAGK
jgi:hypothetical protein